MRTLTTAVEKMLALQTPHYFKRALLYVREWNGSAYVYGSAIDISDYIKSPDGITPIKWKLDKEGYGVWTYSNCTLTLRNDRAQFKEGNSAGFFGINKVIRNSKVQIIAGTISDDGAENPEYIFTGYISAEPIYNLDERTVAITLYDHMAAFEETDAEILSTLLENVLLGSDSGDEFLTTTDKVGLILEVRRGATSGGAVNAEVLSPSTDYNTGDFNRIDVNAKITLTEALAAGESIWATWRQWYGNKEIHWIVDQLCDLAGITSKEISPAIFSSDIENTVTYDTQAQWNTGALTLLDADSYPGSMIVSKLFLINTTFEINRTFAGINWTLYPHGTALAIIYDSFPSGEAAASSFVQPQATGTWDLEMRGEYFVCPFFYFLADTSDITTLKGYCFGRARDDGKWKLYRMNGLSAEIIWNSGFGTVMGPNWARVRIVRTAAGEFYIALYSTVGGLLAGSMISPAVTDNTYSTPGWLITRYSVVPHGGLVASGYVKNIKFTSSICTGGGEYEIGGNWISPEINASESLKNWGQIKVSQNLPAGCSAILETRERDSGGSWGSWIAVLPTGQIVATKRYLQVRWTAATNIEQNLTPALFNLVVPYYTSTVGIVLVNMTGLTAKAALDQLSQITCYEMGFDSVDTFIFRPRTTQLAAVASMDKNNTEKLNTLSDGADRVYNRVVVSFGQYRVVADSTSEEEIAPTSQEKHGIHELAISSASLLPAENVNIAKALAPTVYSYTSKAKRRATVDAKFDLALELGDRVTMNYAQEDIFALWRWGDGDRAYGDEDIQYYSASSIPGAMMLAGVDMRVEGIEFDLENWRTRYDLVEVF